MRDPDAPLDTDGHPDPLPLTTALRDSIAANLDAHDRIEIPLEGRRHAAVAILVVDSEHGSDHHDPTPWEDTDMSMVPTKEGEELDDLDGRMVGVAGGASFVLCRRSSRLNTHSRQWALPGGRIDAGETAVDAALRETDEEVGARLGADRVLGVLDDYATRSGYVITPVVVWGGAEIELHPNPAEVHAIYRIGFHQLLRPDSPRYVEIPESDRPVVQLPLGGDLIHAPTAAMLVQFRWVGLEGRLGERVDHLEQPVFAWG